MKAVIAIFFYLSSFVRAQTVQNAWINPSLPDNSTTLTIGEIFDIKWDSNLQNLFSTYAPNASTSDADLWITGFYQHQYEFLVASMSFVFIIVIDARVTEADHSLFYSRFRIGRVHLLIRMVGYSTEQRPRRDSILGLPLRGVWSGPVRYSTDDLESRNFRPKRCSSVIYNDKYELQC